MSTLVTLVGISALELLHDLIIISVKFKPQKYSLAVATEFTQYVCIIYHHNSSFSSKRRRFLRKIKLDYLLFRENINGFLYLHLVRGKEEWENCKLKCKRCCLE